MREQIEWIAVESRLPGGDDIVLIHAEKLAEPVWFGWYSDIAGWFDIDSAPAVGVTHWARLPKGPRA